MFVIEIYLDRFIFGVKVKLSIKLYFSRCNRKKKQQSYL